MELLISSTASLKAAIDLDRTLTLPLKTTLALEKAPDDVEISVLVCDDPTIRSLNARHRHKDTPTDVLSFPQDDSGLRQDGSSPRILGDIAISVETAARQAEAAGWPLESEIALLAVHGLLHLLGYDDVTRDGAQRMQDRTVEALRAAGIALPAEPEIHPFFRNIDN